jgi:formylglycine-generating enzyme required for sulfatase activity
VTVPGYEVIRELGRGGMGVVYQARHLKLNRLVALKMILAGSHAGAADLARFQTEAEAIARLQHPNIVQIHEVGEHEGKPFFSLEFCGGGSLEKKLNGTPLPAQEAAALMETLARAMQAAHEQHVIHRDLKPANVLLTEDGTPKITDFGLAKKLDEAGQTGSGAVMGTPSYMAPEQAGGKAGTTGPACDVYALGAILYELLTGRPPFRAPTPLDTLMQVVSDEPVPPGRLQSRTPKDVETVCLKCLQKDPTKRYASARALAEDLRRFRSGEPVWARPVGRLERAVKWVKRNPVVTALAAAVVLALAVGTTVSTLKYLDAEQQKQEAQREAAKAARASTYLVSIFKLADAQGQRGTRTARQILDDAEKDIPEKFADQPALRDQLLQQIGDVYDTITATAPLAMILEASGPVQVHATRDPTQRAVPQTLLYTGDRLRLGPAARVQLVILSDLHQERLQPGREATVRRKGCEPADAVAERDRSPLWTFVRLPKGTFYMGWDGQKGSAKKTAISEDFEIAVHAVTQGQWEAVMGNNPSSFARVRDISDEERKLLPVEMVSWDEAQAFIKKLNEGEQKRGGGYWYRLPREAEWEYACRGGATSEEECSYHFYFAKPTNDLSSEQANFNGNFPYGKAPKGKYLGRPTWVGAYPPNKLGLCDMHGNMWQWTSSSVGPDRVIRGGCWRFSGVSCRAADRLRLAPTNRDLDLGFRLARVPRGQRRLDRTEPAALPFRQGFGPGGQKDRGPPGVSSRRERSGWPSCLSRADRLRPIGKTGVAPV